jgi:flagellar hook protein FlgE
MFDSIFIGMSGLQSFSSGLKVISNNVANLNTPGFKSSEARFSNLFYQSGGSNGAFAQGRSFYGSGVSVAQTFINFQPGETRQTGNPLDLSVGGDGFFVTRDAKNGSLTYTRAGQFEFDKDGFLVSRATGRQVMGLGAGGASAPISINGLRISAPKATSVVKLAGNLSSSSTEFAVQSIKVIDALGGEHQLKLTFRPKAGAAGTWTVTATEGDSDVGTGEVVFVGGRPTAEGNKFTFSFTPAGVTPTDVTVDLSGDVTSFDTGTFSSLVLSSADGYAAGSLTKVEFDAKGTLKLTYSNGQTETGAQVALAVFEDEQGLQAMGDGDFTYSNPEMARVGTAGTGRFGAISSSQIEVSNVDLSSEFSDLIVAQRGYQASSRIVSTANEMLQELFEMKGRR